MIGNLVRKTKIYYQELEKTKNIVECEWIEDSQVDKCTLCETNFSLIKRRHHCRMCGKSKFYHFFIFIFIFLFFVNLIFIFYHYFQVFCYSCSSKRMFMESLEKEERVCNKCFKEDEEKDEEKEGDNQERNKEENKQDKEEGNEQVNDEGKEGETKDSKETKKEEEIELDNLSQVNTITEDENVEQEN